MHTHTHTHARTHTRTHRCRSKTIPPALTLHAHSAPLGITFYDWKASCNCKGGFPKSMDGASARTRPPSFLAWLDPSISLSLDLSLCLSPL